MVSCLHCTLILLVQHPRISVGLQLSENVEKILVRGRSSVRAKTSKPASRYGESLRRKSSSRRAERKRRGGARDTLCLFFPLYPHCSGLRLFPTFVHSSGFVPVITLRAAHLTLGEFITKNEGVLKMKPKALVCRLMKNKSKTVCSSNSPWRH